MHNICTITAVHKSWKRPERPHSACNEAGVESQIQTLDYSGSPVEEGEERSEEPEGSETSWEHDHRTNWLGTHGGSESLELVWVWHRFSTPSIYMAKYLGILVGFLTVASGAISDFFGFWWNMIAS